MESFSFQNIIDGQALGISITGMSIVFSGLLLISVYIALLPTALALVTRKSHKGEVASSKHVPAKSAEKPIVEPKASNDEFNDIASVIGLVLQLEHEQFTKVDNEQITISRNNGQPSMWGSVGKMREMPQRRSRA